MNEKALHSAVVRYLKMQHPNVWFHTDLSGQHTTVAQRAIKKSQQGMNGFPDLVIYEPRNEYKLESIGTVSYKYTGLAIELKAVEIYKKNGDLKKSEHLNEQRAWLNQLTKCGFKCHFAVGFEETKQLIDDYLK